ncbi:MAG TPA: winged helix DNA-binding domain-containing protein [Thermoplasmata archaeon]|nr:winged helix DNA-binding domain-containing protein [Thermoplasmata archaeon]
MNSASVTSDAAQVSSDQVAAFRLSRHHLAKRAGVSQLAKVAGDMAGAQAQILSAAHLSLWSRIRGLRLEDLEAALWKDRILVKASCMRGTVHVVPSKDFAVFVRGCAGRADRDIAWLKRAGIPADVVDRIVEAIGKILDRPLTRAELADRLGASVGTKKRVRRQRGWGSRGVVDAIEVDGVTLSVAGLLSHACVRGVACSGPEREDGVTFVRPDAWIPQWRDMPVERAEEELLRRYLRAFGPAAVGDFTWWTYVTAARARETWSRVERELAPVDVDGRRAWMLRKDVRALQRSAFDELSVRLLPYFDSFLLGHKDKGHVVDAAFYKRVYRPAAWLSPVVLVNGRAAGVWSHKRQGRRLAVRFEPFRSISAEVRARMKEEAEDLRRFLDTPEVKVSFA